LRFILFTIILIISISSVGNASDAKNLTVSAAALIDASIEQSIIDLDITPPSLSITSHSVLRIEDYVNPSINLSGVVSDDLKIANVKWYTTRGAGGDCVGIENWSIDNIPLFSGENMITIAATDLAGNIGVDCITIVYQIPVDINIIVPADAVIPGQIVTISVQYINPGAADIKDFILNAKVPAGMEYDAGSAEETGGSWNASASTISWTIDYIASLQSGSRVFRAKIK
jgi:hypothetical protein